MQKRTFLAAGAAIAGAGATWRAAAAEDAKGPALLTVTGAIARTNRGALDPVRDQMMAKQKLAFSKARAFTFADLLTLPAVNLRPTLEYDGQRHALRGPWLVDVLKAAGAPSSGQLAMRAVDGYAPTISIAEARRLGFIVATHLDGAPMPLGGLGPLWAVYEPDRFPELAAKPVAQRFALCPWGLYHIDVVA